MIIHPQQPQDEEQLKIDAERASDRNHSNSGVWLFLGGSMLFAGSALLYSSIREAEVPTQRIAQTSPAATQKPIVKADPKTLNAERRELKSFWIAAMEYLTTVNQGLNLSDNLVGEGKIAEATNLLVATKEMTASGDNLVATKGKRWPELAASLAKVFNDKEAFRLIGLRIVSGDKTLTLDLVNSRKGLQSDASSKLDSALASARSTYHAIGGSEKDLPTYERAAEAFNQKAMASHRRH